MGTNKKELIKGLTYGLGALPLLFAAPVLITIGFKAIKQQGSYIWLLLGIILAVGAILLGFIGIRIILGALFKKKQ